MSKIKEQFSRCVSLKKSIKLPLKLYNLLDYQQSVIQSKNQSKASFMGCYSKKKYEVPQEYVDAFSNLSKAEQIEYFIQNVQFLDNQINHNQKTYIKYQKDTYMFDILLKQGTFVSTWTHYQIQLIVKSLTVKIIGHQEFLIDLHQYILRKSKNTQKHSFVLQAIKSNITKSFRIGFDMEQQFEQCYGIIKLMCEEANRENLSKYLGTAYQTSNTKNDQQINLNFSGKEFKQPSQLELKVSNQLSKGNSNRILVNELMQTEENDTLKKIERQNILIEKYDTVVFEGDMNIQTQIQQIQKIKLKKNLDIFHTLLPNYDLEDFNQENQFRVIKLKKSYRLLQHIKKQKCYRIVINLSFTKNQLIPVIINTLNYRLWNTQVQIGDIRVRIPSQNSAIVYQKHRSYNKFYFARDFLYLRHIFTNNNCFFMIDKSIEHSRYPPFNTITRGHINYCLWSIQQQQKQSILSVEIQMSHRGYLSVQQQQILTIRYLEQLVNIQTFLKQKPYMSLNFDIFFDLDWNMEKNVNNFQKRKQTNQSKDFFKSNLCSQIDQNFYTVNNDEPWDGLQQFQINQQSQLKNKQIKQIQKPQQFSQNHQVADIKLNPETGLVIFPKQYLSKKHRMKPVQCQLRLVENSENNHYCFKNQWKILEDGTALYIHQQKIDEQKKVFKYIISKMGQNLLSGKGILGMSLPVDIFATTSNLQKIAQSFSFAPIFLEKAAKCKNILERIKNTIVFTLGAAIIYIQMEKPFNPILGETYQGSINGCPIFCQQISHHPPISAFYLVGRGYKLYGNFQARVQISVNTGAGINHGEVVVQFDDGQKVRYRTPPGELSGITYGQRKFNFGGKGFYYDLQNEYFTTISFNPTKKGFFSLGKQQKEVDYFQGHIYKVTSSFIQQFKHADKKEGPVQKDILDIVSTVNGRWTKTTFFDGIEYFDVYKDIPSVMIQQKYPLNSNCNYREDIIYRKKKDYARSQIQKQRLQNLQRGDRKLRQKYGKKNNHH